MVEAVKEKWIIDTDPGLDDMMAISYLINRPSAEILMFCTTDGNVGLDIVTNNIKKVLKLSKKKVPVYKGSSNPILKTFPNLDGYHYSDGLGEIDELKNYDASDIQIEKEPSPLKIVETILKYPNQVNLLLIGPLTNIATAYMINPEIADLVKSVYVMGGSILSKGNLNCPGEFNFAYDYIAANIVLSNFRNIIITPWEPTECVYIRNHTHEKIPKILSSKNTEINEELHALSSLIIKKYDEHKNGIQFCDLYSIMNHFNYKVVRRYSACKLKVIIDSKDMLGMVHVSNKREFQTSFDESVKEFKKLGEDYHMIVEKLHDEEVFTEYESVFHLHI